MLSGDALVDSEAGKPAVLQDSLQASEVVALQDVARDPLNSNLIYVPDYAGPSGPLSTRLELPSKARFANREQFEVWAAMEIDRLFGEYFGQSVEHRNAYPEEWFQRSLVVRPVSQFLDFDLTITNDEKVSDSNTTNVQVAGIDEADLVETDGDYLYIASGRLLTVVDIRDIDNPRVAARHQFDGTLRGMYLNDDRLVIVAGTMSPNYSLFSDVFYSYEPSPQSTTITILDISRRESPHLLSETTFNGELVDSRLVNGQLQIVIPNYSPRSSEIRNPSRDTLRLKSYRTTSFRERRSRDG